MLTCEQLLSNARPKNLPLTRRQRGSQGILCRHVGLQLSLWMREYSEAPFPPVLPSELGLFLSL